MNTLIVSSKPYKQNWVMLHDPMRLQPFLEMNQPKRVYFPFWSWKIPQEIIKNFECICFHTGRLPEDAGGSPIQNLIRRGDAHTELNAIRINDKIDGGEILEKRPICLNGSLEEILIRISDKIEDMINVQENNRQQNSKL